jgi:hypothetical protein
VATPSPEILQYLDGRAASMLALRKRQDVESLGTLSAKRRFIRVELDSSGIDPDHVTVELIAAAQAADCPSLAIYLDSLYRLGRYAGSPERQKWNPAAKATDLASQVPVASDWFLQSTYRDEWEEFDFLSRCESIWASNNPTGEGMLFTRIFDYRVKMMTGYEDGMRLVLLLTEVGDYVPPLVLTPSEPEPVEVTPVDLTLRARVFDGLAPNDWSAPISVPNAPEDWAFSLAEVEAQPFVELLDLLGKPAFLKVMQSKRYEAPRNEFQTYVGADQLPLYFCWRSEAETGDTLLLVVSTGEFQPARIMAHFEGAWRVTGGQF